MKNSEINKILHYAGGVLTVLGAFAELFNVTGSVYLFSCGAALLIYLQIVWVVSVWKDGYRERRLALNGFLSVSLLGLGAYFMFVHSNSWVVAVLIYALSSFLLSFRGAKK